MAFSTGRGIYFEDRVGYLVCERISVHKVGIVGGYFSWKRDLFLG